MDLFDITPKEVTVDITDPGTGEEIGLKVRVRPPSSPEVSAVERKYLNELNTKRARNPAQHIESRSLDMICAAVAGWEWSPKATWRGQKLDPIEFTDANVRKLLSTKGLNWIRAQIERQFGDEAAFLPNSATS